MTRPQMAESVLDASAVLALLLREPGSEAVRPRLPAAVISAVNYTEVLARLYTLGGSPDEVKRLVDRHLRMVLPFDAAHAAVAAALHLPTRSAGLSLGDRACLAVGLIRGLPVLTTDQAWRKVDVGVVVEVIR